MREIEFRGKRVDNGVWVTGYYWSNEFGKHFIRRPKAPNGRFSISDREVDPASVGQYTGLKDKNGKKIFEGDILAIDTDDDGDNGERFTVYLDDYEWTAKSRRFEYPFGILRDECEVVGNIYDNPELMEVQE